MRIRSISMKSFMSHADTRLALPATGLVAVVGPVGAGKSGLVEAVATAVWGKSLRGSSPWRDGEEGRAEVEAEGLTVVRTRSAGGRSKVEVGGAGVEFDTAAKADAWLSRRLGDFNAWRRTRVFSSQDAAHFTIATDGERKRLLEGILGIDGMDAALEACRVDRRSAEKGLEMERECLAVMVGRLEGERGRLRDAEAVLVGLPPEAPAAGDDSDAVRRMLVAVDADLSVLRKAIWGGQRSGAVAEQRLASVREQLGALSGSKCDRCGQEIPARLRDSVTNQVKDLELHCANLGLAVEKETAGYKDDASELEEEQSALRKRLAELDAQARDAQQAAGRRRNAMRTLEQVRSGLQELEGKLAAAKAAVETGAHRLAVLESAEEVLGLRGVRAGVLAKSLAGIEALSNAWLVRIAGEGLRLRLRPYVEKATGGVTDALGLEVEGAGGGHGYRGASGGERRRVDAALLLALSEVAEAARGQEPGTCFFDEVLDALDEGDAQLKVAQALAELAATRAVVVISHLSGLVDILRRAAQEAGLPVLALRVEGGTVEVLP